MFRSLISMISILFFPVYVFLSTPAWSFFSPYQAGESVQSVIEKLKTDPLVFYQDKQVIMSVPIIKDSQITYEVDKRVRALAALGQGGYIKQMYFYFKDERLSSLSLTFSPKFTSFHDVFLKLTQKYGQPTQVKGPNLVEWEEENIIVRLTRPINIKYIDKSFLEENEKAHQEKERKDISVKESIFDRL